MDHQVGEMDADRGHHPGRRAVRAEPPVVRGEFRELVVADIRLEQEELAQRPFVDEPLQFLECRFPTPLMADAEDLAGGAARLDDATRALASHRQRLLAEQVLARRR